MEPPLTKEEVAVEAIKRCYPAVLVSLGAEPPAVFRVRDVRSTGADGPNVLGDTAWHQMTYAEVCRVFVAAGLEPEVHTTPEGGRHGAQKKETDGQTQTQGVLDDAKAPKKGR